MTGVQFSPCLVGVCERDGIRVLDAPSLWAVLGPRLALPDRVALGDAILHAPRIGGNRGPTPRSPHATLEELVVATEMRRRKGRLLLREALPLLRTSSASAPESHLRLALDDAGIIEPELDYDVYAPDGRYLGTSEFAFPRYRVALEFEGDHHRTEVRQWDRDIEKYHDYRRAGWEPIRVTARMLYSARRKLMADVRAVLVERGWQG